MAAAARSAARVLQIGHCIRFWPDYVVTRQLIQGGLFGRTIAASFRRYYPGTEEAHTNPTRQRGECLRALAGASG
jgi:predicted dehydrogenase